MGPDEGDLRYVTRSLNEPAVQKCVYVGRKCETLRGAGVDCRPLHGTKFEIHDEPFRMIRHQEIIVLRPMTLPAASSAAPALGQMAIIIWL